MAEQTGPGVIPLALTSPEEMFVLAPADLFSEFRNFMTGLEYCISVLRSGPSNGPVRVEMALPAHRISEGIEQRVRRTLKRYCEHRIEYNRRERRAVRLDGLFSLWIGLPIVVLGFVLVIIKGSIVGSSGNANLGFDSGGWVLVWVGLWFPLDTLLFTPVVRQGEPGAPATTQRRSHRGTAARHEALRHVRGSTSRNGMEATEHRLHPSSVVGSGLDLDELARRHALPARG